jgi:hypothetical protein
MVSLEICSSTYLNEEPHSVELDTCYACDLLARFLDYLSE